MAEERMLNDEILLGLIKANSGGGGGTDDYNDLKNQPKIEGVTLTGNKTASDLGLASEDDLADKQDVLTAGDYVSITNDGTINVTKAIGVYDRVRYVFTPEGGGYYMRVEVYINDVKRFEQQYQNTAVFNHVVIMDLIEFWYGGDGYYWHYKPLIDSREHAKDIVISWYYTEMDVHEETFDVPQDDSTTLATKGDIDAAISSAYHHAGTKTCAELVAGLLVAGNEGNVYNMTDSGTTTSDFIEGAGQPIKAGDNVGIAKISDGVYKFDLLSGFVDTSNFVQKSVTAGLLKNDGTVNDEIEEDVSKLKSGLTNVQNNIASYTVGTISYNENNYVNQNGTYIKKNNAVKMLQLAISSISTIIPTGSWVTVLTIPSDYAPVNSVNFNLSNTESHYFALSIKTNGNVDIYNYAADTKIDGSYNFTFI